METCEEEDDDGVEEADFQSMFKLFFKAIEYEEEEEETSISWTPNSLSPPTRLALWVVQVLEL